MHINNKLLIQYSLLNHQNFQKNIPSSNINSKIYIGCNLKKVYNLRTVKYREIL